jgi:hypothetical protein
MSVDDLFMLLASKGDEDATSRRNAGEMSATGAACRGQWHPPGTPAAHFAEICEETPQIAAGTAVEYLSARQLNRSGAKVAEDSGVQGTDARRCDGWAGEAGVVGE